MPDGPIVALIVLAACLALAGGYYFVEHRRHAHRAPKRHARAVERIPLFGAHQLATRDSDGALHVGEDADDPRPAPPPRPARPAPLREPHAAPGVTGVASTPPAPFPAHASDGASTSPAPRPAPPRTGADAPGTPTAPRPAYVPPPARRPAFAGATAGLANAPDALPDRAPAFAPRPSAPAMRPAPVATPGDDPLLNGETLRFALPDEGTLRFLPGRLEVVSGAESGREIRFVAPPGSEPPEVTFGRNEGPAYRHVQLLARTVSRRHAVMLLSEGHWSLRNLSATNPVVLNGRALAPDELAPLLVDGDRIEMGEVTFIFHSR